MITPIPINRIALFLGISNKNEATDPVQAPVIGNGIATKIISAHAPYLRYFFSNVFMTLLNHQLNNLSKNLNFELSQSATGFKNQTIKIAGTISPKIEIPNASHGFILKNPIAKGIEPLNSVIGSMANKKVASQAGN